MFAFCYLFVSEWLQTFKMVTGDAIKILRRFKREKKLQVFDELKTKSVVEVAQKWGKNESRKWVKKLVKKMSLKMSLENDSRKWNSKMSLEN